MADKLTPERRSWNMSQIRSTDTKPEEYVRKFLFASGLRYRKNDKRYPGKPDIVLPKYHTVIFVNGCFWHAHNCNEGHIPKSNSSYWEQKLQNNIARDQKNYKLLKEKGWKIIIVWECELKTENTKHERCQRLLHEITEK